jgi:hypothetical protein
MNSGYAGVLGKVLLYCKLLTGLQTGGPLDELPTDGKGAF